MPKEKSEAELDAIFETTGVELPEDEETVVEEGDGQPSAAAPAKEPASTPPPAADEDEDEPGDERTRARFQKLNEELKRYKRYEHLVDMFEEEPDLARRVAAHRMGIDVEPEPRQPVRREPVQPQGPTPEQAQQIREYWAQRFEADPISAMADLTRQIVAEQNRGSRNVSARTAQSIYKSQRRQADPLFSKYEPYFDQLVQSVDPDKLIEDPDGAFEAIEAMAFGRWAQEQRKAAQRAKSRNKVAERETPPPAEPRGVSKPVNKARPKRELTEEERYLADIYGEDAVLADDEESENIWGR